MEETKRRVPFTDIERQKLRMQHKNFPSLAQQGLIAWFEQEFGRQISPSSVSEILSSKYSRLDDINITVTTRKKGGSQWAELEDALFKQWRELQPCSLTLEKLREKALEIWKKMPAMQESKKPSFSDGWLVKWKTRHKIPVGLSTHITPIHVGQNFKRRSDDALELEDINQAYIKHRQKRQRVQENPVVNGESQIIQCPSGLAISKSRWQQGSREPVAAEAAPWFNQRSSTSIQDLLRSHAIQNGKGNPSYLPGHVIHRYFGSILDIDSLHLTPDRFGWYSKDVSSCLCETLDLLMSSEAFELEETSSEALSPPYEAWELDWINPDRIRSPSPRLSIMDGCAKDSERRGSKDRLIPGSRQISLASVVSNLWKGARIGYFTKTYKQVKTAATNQETDYTESRITITPPATSPSAMQVIFLSTSQTCGHFSTLITPTISFRNIRSENATIFKIARAGTARALEMAFARGEGSLSDCDQGGRSLLNVSHILRHPSKTYMWTVCASWLKYLCARISSASCSRS
jgi:hypothetical protein